MDELLHIVVKGIVQGVGYRAFALRAAQRHGAAGWVRNLSGGEVEILARIAPEHRSRFLAELERGPTMSQVDRVEVGPPPAGWDCPASGFTIRF